MTFKSYYDVYISKLPQKRPLDRGGGLQVIVIVEILSWATYDLQSN